MFSFLIIPDTLCHVRNSDDISAFVYVIEAGGVKKHGQRRFFRYLVGKSERFLEGTNVTFLADIAVIYYMIILFNIYRPHQQ